jgi:hypothetical protein
MAGSESGEMLAKAAWRQGGSQYGLVLEVSGRAAEV